MTDEATEMARERDPDDEAPEAPFPWEDTLVVEPIRAPNGNRGRVIRDTLDVDDQEYIVSDTFYPNLKRAR